MLLNTSNSTRESRFGIPNFYRCTEGQDFFQYIDMNIEDAKNYLNTPEGSTRLFDAFSRKNQKGEEEHTITDLDRATAISLNKHQQCYTMNGAE